MFAFAGTANADAYRLDITTSYGSSYQGPAFLRGGYSPNPATGFLTFTNSGPSTFYGSLGYDAPTGFGGDVSQSVTMFPLTPGFSVYFNVGDHASGAGGFGGAYYGAFCPTCEPVQTGIRVFAVGFFDSTAVDLSVFDADIHSGDRRDNPFHVVVDSYVIQGGDPYGRDTGDAFAVNQAAGHYSFQGGAAPEPAAWALMILGFGGVGASIRRRKVTASAA